MSLESIVSLFITDVSVRKVDPKDAVGWYRDRRGEHGLNMQDYSRFVDAVMARGIEVPLIDVEAASKSFTIPESLKAKTPNAALLASTFRRGGVEGLLEALDKKLDNRQIGAFLAANEATLGKELHKFFEDAPAWYDVESHWRRQRRGRRAGVEFLEPYKGALRGDEALVARTGADGSILVLVDGEEIPLRPDDEGTIWRHV